MIVVESGVPILRILFVIITFANLGPSITFLSKERKGIVAYFNLSILRIKFEPIEPKHLLKGITQLLPQFWT